MTTKGDMRKVAGWRPTPAERETLKALAAPKRKPTEADAPPLSTFPGKAVKPTSGQLDLFGGEAR